MRTRLRTIGLLLAWMCMPFHLSAQSQHPTYAVSVRELSIPPRAQHAFEQGMERLASRDAAGSLPHFQRAILEYAGYYEAYDRMGAADLMLWHVQEAEQAFRKAIEVSGGQYAHPLIALGAILDDQEKFAEAESVIRKGLDLDHDSWKGHFYLALALFGSNRMEDAAKSVLEALQRKTDFPNAHLLLANIHCREKDYHSVIRDLDEYLKLAPDGPDSSRAKALRAFAQNMISASQGNTDIAQSQ